MNSDSVGVFGNSTRGQKMSFHWVPFSGSTFNGLSQKSPSLDATTLFTEITRLSQPSTIQPEMDSIVAPEESRQAVHIPSSHFPSILVSQSVPSHSQIFPSQIVSSQQSISRRTKKRERVDWSVINKDKFSKQSFETTVLKRAPQSVPLSQPLAHLQQLPSPSSMKRRIESLQSRSEASIQNIPGLTNKEWRTMLDEESKQIPELIPSNSMLGEPSSQLRQLVVSRDALGTVPDIDTQSITYRGETIVLKKEMRYAKVVWMDENPSVQRIVLAVNGRYPGVVIT